MLLFAPPSLAGNKNCRLKKKENPARPPPAWLWHRQRNGQWLWTTRSKLLHSVYNSWQHLRFDNSRWSSSVDDSCCLMPSQSAGRIKVWTLFFTWNQNISGEGVSGEDLNVPTESVVPTSTVTMGLPCLVFEIWPLDGQQRCTKDGRRTDNGPTLARVAYLALNVRQH